MVSTNTATSYRILMKYFSIFLPFIFLTISYAFEPQSYEDFKLEMQESIKSARIANNKLTDEEVMKHLEDVLKYLPDQLSEIKNQNSLEKSQSLKNIREHYTAGGISIFEMNESFEKAPEYKEMMAKIWANDTLGVEYAETIILSLSNEEYGLIVDVAIDLINKRDQLMKPYKPEIIKENIPNQLDFINIEFIRVYEDYCDIFLYKGIGGMKSIGYKIQKDKNANWVLYHFNFLKSWDKYLIDFKSNSINES